MSGSDRLVRDHFGGKVEVKAGLKGDEDKIDPETIQLLRTSYRNASLLFSFLLLTPSFIHAFLPSIIKVVSCSLSFEFCDLYV